MERAAIIEFRKTVWDYYEVHGRYDLPWRVPEADGSFDPYKILISEVMLQQTQVIRCIPIYQKLIYQFSTVSSLAAAPLSEVLIAWSGLGYNRRAKYLHQAAQMVVGDFNGKFPRSEAELVKLPGVGTNTAGAIMAYAFNEPVVFIETNIRTVFIHHFFKGEADIPDTAIAKLVEQTLDTQNPRVWYWALMDYGSFLKKSVGNLNTLSKHYVKQSPLEGSHRQIRGQVLRLLATTPLAKVALVHHIPDVRLPEILLELENEQLITQDAGVYRLGN
jgi:A/G-specific adenine glycosylase